MTTIFDAFVRASFGAYFFLGAQREQVSGLVLKHAIALSLIGVEIGIGASFAATPLLSTFLYGVKKHNPYAGIGSSLLVAVTFFASYVPARQITKIAPMRTPRYE